MADATSAKALHTTVQRYLDPNADAESPELCELVCAQVAPTIRSIVAYKLGGSAETIQDIDDVCADVVLALLARLDDLRSKRASFDGDFFAYVAVSSYNACSSYFRNRFPERERIKNRLRYLLKPSRGFDLWQENKREWYCGFAAWRGARSGRDPAPRSLWGDDLPASAENPVQLLAAVFDRAGAPVRFEELVDVATELWAAQVQKPAGDAEPLSRASHDAEVDSTAMVARIWQEIVALPLGQRQALLLNLRGENSGCAIALFPTMGVASLQQIASALEIPIEEFARLWNVLPLEDAAIAQRLGITRQQVINLRKSARRRLERRMALE